MERLQVTNVPCPESNGTGSVDASLTPFSGGELILHDEHVELCGIVLFRGKRAARYRAVLVVLARKGSHGSFRAYGSEELAELVGIRGTDSRKRENNAGGLIRHIRNQITTGLRSANIECGKNSVILSGGPGYRFASCLSVQFAAESQPNSLTDIKTEDVPVENVPIESVPIENVPV